MLRGHKGIKKIKDNLATCPNQKDDDESGPGERTVELHTFMSCVLVLLLSIRLSASLSCWHF